jgi:predicted nuclease of predicted toxin-antitoxin system
MAKLREDVFFFDANCDSVTLLKRLRDEQGLVCVGRIEQFGEPRPGQPGVSDQAIFEFCQQQGFTIVTKNCRDFERLAAANDDLHYGLILIRDGELTSQEMYEELVRVLREHPDSLFCTRLDIKRFNPA